MTITWMNLKDARALRGWTQAQLAEALGVHQKTIVNWESTGVPPKSEYKVRRVLADELRYGSYADRMAALGDAAETFEHWLEIDRLRDAMLSDNPPEEEVDSKLSEAYDLDVADRQKEFDERAARINALGRFSSQELLFEVTRRISLLEEEQNVRAARDTETQDDYARAARKRSKDRGWDTE